MTTVWAWACAIAAGILTLGAAYFFDKSAEEGIQHARKDAAEANRRASELEVAAEIARKGIAEANARAAEANQKAEEEKLARVRIEERLAPRRLTIDQKHQIVQAITPFAGKRIRVTIPFNDPEASAYAQDFLSALTEAGWLSDGADQATYDKPAAGVQVTIRSDEAVGRGPDHVLALVRVLHSLGITGQGFHSPTVEPNGVELRIGTKPIQ